MSAVAATAFPAPSLETIARLVEQAIDEQHETREHLDAYIRISDERTNSLEKRIESVDSKSTAHFLTLTGQLADTQKHIARVEGHVGFLTMKVTEHDKRFDSIDTRLDEHDKRFDKIDTRLDGIDARLDTVDIQLENINTQLVTIAQGVAALQQAPAPKAD